MKQFSLVLASILIVVKLAAQQAFPTLPQSDLKKDFSIFCTALKEAHPGFYTYHDSAYWAEKFKETEKLLSTPLTELEFYRLLNPLVAEIKCGHTKWHRKGQPDNLYAFHQTGLFPLKLYFQDKRAYMMEGYTKTNIPKGAEIIRINERSIASVTALLNTQVFADGMVESSRWQMLSEQFPGYYATFIGPSSTFVISYRLHNGQIKKAVVPAVDLPAIRNQEISGPQDTLGLHFPAKSVALLRIPVFMPQEGGPEWESFLANAFHRIQDAGIENLVIDLRNNEGGMDLWGAQLFAWLTDKPFRYYDRLTVVSDKEFSFRQYATLPEQYDQLKAFIKKQGNEYIFTMHPGLEELQPAASPFKGKVYILINGRSFSVTSEFAAIAQDLHRAVFVGEESGGTIDGDNSGGFAIVKLPNTKLTLAIPLLRYHMHLKGNYDKGRGIIPDIKVTNTVQEQLNNQDAVLKKALMLIGRP